jgi:hypothetical protein
MVCALATAGIVGWSVAAAFGMSAGTAPGPQEPASMLLLGGALIGFAASVRRPAQKNH